jgi:hypothetical protein
MIFPPPRNESINDVLVIPDLTFRVDVEEPHAPIDKGFSWWIILLVLLLLFMSYLNIKG